MDAINGVYRTLSRLLDYTDLTTQHCCVSGGSSFLWKIPNFAESSWKKSGHLQSPSFVCCDAEWALRFVTSHDGTFTDVCISRIASKVESHSITISISFWYKQKGKYRCPKQNFEVNATVWNKITKFNRTPLIVHCYLRASYGNRNEPEKLAANHQRENDSWENVFSSDFEALLKNQRKCDVVLQVGEEKLLAHKLILGARTPVLAGLLKQDALENGMIVVNVPDIPPSAVRDLLHYIYTGRIPTLSVDTAVELYTAANMYDMTELMEQCVKIMLAGLTVNNIRQLATVADKFSDAKMMGSVIYFAQKNSSALFSSNDWRDLLKSEPNVASEIMRSVAAAVCDSPQRKKKSGVCAFDYC